MPPKKRDKESDSSKNRPPDQYQADHELFLNAFEKPTQIYRFLRTRNMISPIFLNRTLTYMRERMSRNHKARKDFRVNSMLAKVRDKCLSNDQNGERRYLTLTFLGFYDKTNLPSDEFVKVETSITKMSHKKRKDSSAPVVKLFVGTSEVPINPPEEHPPAKVPAISIPSDSFNSNNGNLIRSYILYIKATKMDSSHYISASEEPDTVEPSAKRLKKEDAKYFGAELTVYDRHNRCLLMTGDYELSLQEIEASSKQSPKGNQWVTMENTEDEAFDLFNRSPMIKFRLEWTSVASHGYVDRPKPFKINGAKANKENRPEKSAAAATGKEKEKEKDKDKDKEKDKEKEKEKEKEKGKEKEKEVEKEKGKEKEKETEKEKDKEKDKDKKKDEQEEKKEKRPQIVYQFLYNNNSRQQTEACDDLMCPWCSLNCITLYSLLKHLKLCHSRFTFTYNQIPEGARIDVAINDSYDGSYTGSPHDLISQPPGFAFARNGPVRRTSVTNVLVCRPKRPRPSLSEFLECEENDFDGQQRPYITGHNRLYHHTTTCLPVHPKEMDIDSEGENDPKWLQQKTIMMIDDFTDVNEGEKELMKMWNLHVMKHGYVGDCQIPLACLMFIKSKGDELVRKNLYRNFVLHVCNLFDFGLISSQTVYMIIRQLQDTIRKKPENVALMAKYWREQRTAGLDSDSGQPRRAAWRRAPDEASHSQSTSNHSADMGHHSRQVKQDLEFEYS